MLFEFLNQTFRRPSVVLYKKNTRSKLPERFYGQFRKIRDFQWNFIIVWVSLTPEESGVNFDQRIDTFQIQSHLDERFSLAARLLNPHFHDSQVERPCFSTNLQNE